MDTKVATVAFAAAATGAAIAAAVSVAITSANCKNGPARALRREAGRGRGVVHASLSSCDYTLQSSGATPAGTSPSGVCWNRANALWCADAVGLAYANACGHSAPSSHVPHGTRLVTMLYNRESGGALGPDTRAIGYVAQDLSDAGTYYVIFRGTEGVIEWLADVKMAQVALPGVPGAAVHSGFYNALVTPTAESLFPSKTEPPSLIDQVIKAVSGQVAEPARAAHAIGELDNGHRLMAAATPERVARPVARQLFVCGHSLGAGLAQECAALLKGVPALSGPSTTMRVYTYGNPRTGNSAFADHLGRAATFAEVYNHMNTADLVPQHPAGLDLLPFAHHPPYQQAGRVIAFADQHGTVGGNHLLQHYRASLAALDPSGCRPPQPRTP